MLTPMTGVASPTQRSESLPFHPMMEHEQLHGPAVAPMEGPIARATHIAGHANILSVTAKDLKSDRASDSENRIRELEDENLSLRKEGFSKDREIRKLKSELLRRGVRAGSYEAGMKRPRCNEDI